LNVISFTKFAVNYHTFLLFMVTAFKAIAR